jgi:hypothetical protein
MPTLVDVPEIVAVCQQAIRREFRQVRTVPKIEVQEVVGSSEKQTAAAMTIAWTLEDFFLWKLEILWSNLVNISRYMPRK